MRGFLRLGKITGIPVSVHWTLAVIAWFLGMGLATGALPASVPHASTAAYWGTALVGVVVFFGSVLVHELSHALVARRFGVATDGIELWLLGGMARLNRDSPSPKADGLIAVAGPAASLLLGAGFIGAAVGLGAVGAWPLVAAMVAWLGIVNIIIALFNLLPGAPLDGGRILRAVRWARHHDRLRATNEAAQAGQVLGWAIVIIGVWALFKGWGGIFLPLTGGFLVLSAKGEQLAAAAEARLAGVTVDDVTWYGVAEATADTDAETMLGQRGRLGAPRVVAVQDGLGRLTGLVAEDQLWLVPEHQRPVTRLAQLMVPFSRMARAEPHEALGPVLARVTPQASFITVWRDDRLVGVVTREALQRRLQALAPAPAPA
jgi:Zn-dependent protease